MATERISFSDISSFSRLFSTYTAEFSPLASFFAGDYRDPRQRGQISRQVADKYSFRNELVEVLTEQNTGFGVSTQTLANIERLSDHTAVAVVTGQQLGLFGGPLYTLLKTITTIQLARRLESEAGRPVVPVFWLEGEDHDIAEAASSYVLEGNERRRLEYSGKGASSQAAPHPVGRLKFDKSISRLADQLEEWLPPTDFRADLMEAVRGSYLPGKTFMESFAGLMIRLFSEYGLVFISGDDPRLKRGGIPLFRKEIREPLRSAELLNGTSSRLEDGYHVQIRTQPCNLFLLTDSGRRSLQLNGDRFTLKGGQEEYSEADLLSMLEETPEVFSPNVVLRPLLQDTILPTAAYVAGPGEIAYFAQLRPLYEWANIPMPIIYPRASVTLVEPRIGKILDRHESPISVFEQPLDKLFHEMVLGTMEIDPDQIFNQAGRHLHEAVDSVKPVIELVDSSLEKAGEATRAALLKEWGRFRDRVIKAEKKRHDVLRNQLDKAKSTLFPDGVIQERQISPLYFLNKFGMDLVDRLVDEIELDTSSHQVIRL